MRHSRRLLRLGGVAGLAAILIVVSTAPAEAAPTRQDFRKPVTVAADCQSQIATLAPTDTWLCMGDGITVARVDSQGRRQVTFTPFASTNSLPHVSIGGVTPMTGTGDPDDTWCEMSGICHSKTNEFIAKTKGNGQYGFGTQPLGNIDIIVTTNLNGRSGRWSIKLIWDDGPQVTFTLLMVTCWEDNGIWPDNNCGNHYFSGVPQVGPVFRKYETSLIQGNRLVNVNDYYAEAYGIFTAAGYEDYQFPMGTLRTMNFLCPANNGRCYFQ